MSAYEENLYTSWLEEDRSEKRSMRLSLAVAVVLHGALLAVVVPEYSAAPAAARDERVVYVVETVRFKEQLPPPTPTPQRPVTRIPIPAPDPSAPDIYVSDEELVPPPDLDQIDTASLFTLPDAPPAPPEKLVYQVGEVDPPERIHYVEPQYTDMARLTRTHGAVILQATIDTRGNVVDLKVLKSLGMGLTEAALEAVEQWKFRPSAVDGRPVSVLYNLTVNFQLR